MGQIYLVTVVSLIVGNLGRRGSPPSGDAAAAPPGDARPTAAMEEERR
jgi:hypothetical protein